MEKIQRDGQLSADQQNKSLFRIFIDPFVRRYRNLRRLLRKNYQLTFPIRRITERERTAEALLSVLNNGYGHWLSVASDESINKDHEPIPWYTYPAVDYLDQINFKDKTVFEWGSGNSSLYWSRVAQSVTSVEDNPGWYGRIERNQNQNLEIMLLEDKDKYVNAIGLSSRKFDVIIVDGSYRYECACIAPKSLNKGGLIILDNSDWLPRSAKVLRDANLLQVDMNGFGPIATFTFTTSLFFDRDFCMPTKSSSQPQMSKCGIPIPGHFLYQEPR